MNNACSGCRHAKVCRYVNDFKKFAEKVAALLEAAKAEGIDISLFKIDVTCRFFTHDDTFNPFDPFKENPHKKTLNEYMEKINKQDVCDTCPNKPDPTKLVIGDSPCQWCQHYPFKITCDAKR